MGEVKQKLNARARARFIELLRERGNVSLAARELNVTRKSLYACRRRDENFAEQWEEALEEVLDSCESEAIRRGRDGILRPLSYQGRSTGDHIREYSDRLLEAFLKGRGRWQSDRGAVQVNVPVQVNIVEPADAPVPVVGTDAEER